MASNILENLLDQVWQQLDQLNLVAPGCDSKHENKSTQVLPSSNLQYENIRLKTFGGKWPLKFPSPQLFASNGFYYLGRGDEVRCAFCQLELMHWMEGDDPAKDHQLGAPQCTFLRRQASSGNVPMKSSPTTTGHDECGIQPPITPNPIRSPGPAHPRYASTAARIQSFRDWPTSNQKHTELAEAGFFYTGQGDKTKCFYCDGGLKDWESNDVPWEQHARWFHRCLYIRLVKGQEYIEKVCSEVSVIPAPVEEKEEKEKPRE
ncbi:death-associated inhibitor of apoptosis 1-like [Maniola jurtina]|uniref:death-associated inhibitor of apoptosis 1-like n=1 Tax=Maniola jurtina TaxID=191418 RepID=UPI001E68B37B|nr:death-associated inhibitor of apoptosis 1-like [Maniola jurtina]